MKKGFTLVELLAVIIIIAIIALIATPLILNVIETARKGAAKSSALGYIYAINNAIILGEFNNIDYNDGTYEIGNEILNKVSFKGIGPSKGKITIKDEEVIYAELCINNYSIKYENDKAFNSVNNYCKTSYNYEITLEVDNNVLLNEIGIQSSTIFDVDATNFNEWKVLNCNNGAIPKYENGVVNISNISDDTNCSISPSLYDVVDNIDDSKNYVYMINDEELTLTLDLREKAELTLDLNGKTISNNSTAVTIGNYGILNIKDDTKLGNIVNNFTNGQSINVQAGTVNIEYARLDGSAYGILNENGIVNINDIYINAKTTAIKTATNINASGTTNINGGTYIGYNVIANNYKGIVNINAGIFEGKNEIINNERNGVVNITDSKGYVYMTRTVGVSEGIINGSNNELYYATISIKGNSASKTVNGVTKYNEEACTQDKNDIDSGICFYSNTGGAFISYYGKTMIDGGTYITSITSLYQVRSGIVNISNAYMKSFGETCGSADIARCSTIRNHYYSSVIEINNSTIINEHGNAIRGTSANLTTINSGLIYSTSNSAILTEVTAAMTINGGTIYSNSGEAAITNTGTGLLTINNGNIYSATAVSAVQTSKGILIINDGEFNSLGNTILIREGATTYINGGTFNSTTDNIIRGSIKLDSADGCSLGISNIYINGGSFTSTGSAIVTQGYACQGNIYICNGSLSTLGKDFYNITNAGSKIYYSNKVKFTNGTNIPTYSSGTFINSNYTGSCQLPA